ncbi:MAG: glycosyltransferase, partial [Muribaculaceae bacterium]|nr:glycosyltransferase [Muribaculaceae bacterium]
MSSQQPLKVVLINHADTIGGASVVTTRLMRALREEGVDAHMIVYTKTLDDDHIVTLSTRFRRSMMFMAEAASGAMANGFDRKHLFEISTASYGYDISRHPLIREADVICLNWINQGLLSIKNLRQLASLGKPIVWTMHDMWPMTGVCHHARGCNNFTHGCGNCPQLYGRKGPNDRSAVVNARKKRLYDMGNFTFVPVSHWLAEQAGRSSLLAGRPMEVIPNAFPIDFYITEPTHLVQSFNIDYSKNLIVMGASRLDDPVKGLDHAVDALNYLFDCRPDVANNALAVFYGSIREQSKLSRLRFPYRFVDRVNDPKMLRQLFASAKVVLSSSLVETLPGTLIEGQAGGAIPVSFDNGGQYDIIDHKKSGYLAPVGDYKELARGIVWALETDVDRQYLHDEVDKKFNASVVAHRY